MKQNGFTLLELLVVSAIILGITGFAISNYNDFNRVERLRQTGKTLKSDLRLAQTQASSGTKPSTCGVGTTLDGYTMTFTQTTYTIQASCSGASSGPTTTITFPASTGITFSPIPASFLFNVLTGRVVAAQALTLSGAGHTYKIAVSISGDINDSGAGLGYQ